VTGGPSYYRGGLSCVLGGHCTREPSPPALGPSDRSSIPPPTELEHNRYQSIQPERNYCYRSSNRTHNDLIESKRYPTGFHGSGRESAQYLHSRRSRSLQWLRFNDLCSYNPNSYGNAALALPVELRTRCSGEIGRSEACTRRQFATATSRDWRAYLCIHSRWQIS
jgi:hypothetical protein